MYGFGAGGGRPSVKRAWVVALLFIVAAVPVATAAPWLQPRGDAAATGFQPGEGPGWPDVALRVEIPDPFTPTFAQPLIFDDTVLMLVSPHDAPLTFTGPWRVLSLNLTTGELAIVTELPLGEGPSYGEFWDQGAPGGLATDGSTVYVAGNHSVHAIPIGPAGRTWTQELGPSNEDGGPEPCGRLRLEPDHITVLCAGRGVEEPTGELGDLGARPLTRVARLDVATGEPVWTWTHPSPVGSGPQVPSVPPDDPRSRSVLGSNPVGLAVSGPLVVVQTWDAQAAEEVTGEPAAVEFRFAVRGLEAVNGNELWNWTGDPVAFTDVYVGPDARLFLTGNPAMSEQAVFVKTNALQKLAIGNGAEQWSRQIGDEDLQEGFYVPGVALAEGNAYVMSGQTLYKMNAEEPRAGWTTTLDQSQDQFFYWDPIVTPSTLYTGASLPSGAPGPLYAFDVDTGEVRWTRPSEGPAGFAVGQGLMVYGEHTDIDDQGPEHVSDDFIVVLGRTSASPTPTVSTSSLYPAPGETVQVDLSESQAGIHGPVTRYMAVWGDGTTTDWQDDPLLNHTYDQPGNVTARFVVGNDGMQTNSTTMTFHVGQTPPTDPTFLEKAFSRQNQALTFSILVAILVVVGIAGAVIRQRRREAHEAGRLEAYERVLKSEIAEGRDGEGLTRRMAPVRAALWVSEKEHARMVETLRAQEAGTSVTLVPGRTFLGRYKVKAPLGTGGGGTAYLCHDRRIERDVVVKALHTVGEDVDATVREARAFGAINHGNVVSLHDVEEVGGRVFLVLEYVQGGSLDGLDGRPELKRLAVDLLSGLAAVHAAGVVHRDVKPSNVLVTQEGGFKLADFGVARTPGFHTSVGGLGGGAVGTVQYMSPEQAKGRPVGPRSDLYSAAVVLWEAFTGKPYMQPRPGETATELQMRIAQADGLPRIPEGASQAQQAWFEQALNPDPEARFQDAETMLDSLGAAMGFD